MYSDEALKDKRRQFLRECKPKAYRALRAAGELEDDLTAAMRRCVQRAEDLIDDGVIPAQAWSWAIRSQILESAED